MRHLLALRPELHLFALDQRGHGESSMPDPETCRGAPERCFRPADFAADVLAFMDQRAIERAYLVGHSMGGLVAQEIALTHPERVERLVLIATWASMIDHPVVGEFLISELIEGPWKEALVRQGYEFPEDIYELTPLDVDPEAEAWLAVNWVTEPAADPAFLAQVLPETSRTRLGTWLGVARSLLATDNRERLKELAVPALVISATQDGMSTEADETTLIASLDGAARSCRTSFVLKRYGRKPLPPSGLAEDEIAHNVQWAAAEGVASDLAAYLREDGQPTRDLYYADPRKPRRVLTAPGEATLIEGRTLNCGRSGAS
jgi:pimeloyl-ACP methyl ester carboxylesterase